MGCVTSKDSSSEEQQNTEEIDDQLQLSKLQAQLHYKALCLGAGESGKSTVIKMLRLIFQGKMKKDELIGYRPTLHWNTLQCMKTLLKQVEHFQYKIDASLSEAVTSLTEIDLNEAVTTELAAQVSQLWKDAAVQQAYERRSEYWLLDAAKYYFENVERFAGDYVPTEEDIIMSRTRTTGLILTEFNDGPLRWTVVDVGGQRSERKKWVNAFDDVKCILFIVNLGGYATVLFEDETKNRLMEELDVFEGVVSKPPFNKTEIFLVLNKKDLFEEQLRKVPLTKCFPEYAGGDDVHAALKFVEDQFRKRLPAGRDLAGVHAVSARFKKDIKAAFEEVKLEITKGKKQEVTRAVELIARQEARMKAREVQKQQAAEAKP